MSDIWEYVSSDLEFIIDSVVVMRHYTKLDELDDYETVEDYITENINHGDIEDVDVNNVETDFVSRHNHNQKLQEMRHDRNTKVEERDKLIMKLQQEVKKLEKQLRFIGGGEE